LPFIENILGYGAQISSPHPVVKLPYIPSKSIFYILVEVMKKNLGKPRDKH
jgi:hypothetical protein